MRKTIDKGYPYRNREILVIDLTKDEYSCTKLDEKVCTKYHGGRALAYKLWVDYVDWDTINKDCLYVGAPIVISLGAASDLGFDFAKSSTLLTYSLESKSVVSYNFSSKSFALALSSLGFSALVIRGRARRLTNIEIWKSEIKISLCENFHNLNTRDIEMFLEKASSIISIGAPGEKAIDYASVNIDSLNVGRSGVGAIFGMKNLKCVAIYSSKDKIRLPYYEKLSIEVNTYFEKRKKVNILEYASKYGWAAIESFKYRTDPRLWGLGSDLTPDCDLDWLIALALGANIGIYDWKKVKILEECCLSLGVDPISIGIFLNWVLFAEEEKIIDLKIDKNVDIIERLIIIIEYLATSKSHFSNLNEGVNSLSKKFGFNKFNFTSLNKELLPLDLRGLKAFSLSVALDDDTFVPWEMFGELKKKNVVKALYTSQIYREICEILGLSWKNVLYLAYIDGKLKKTKNRFINILTKVFAIAEGYKISEEDLFNLGKRSFFVRRNIEEISKNEVVYSINNIPIYFLTNRFSNYGENTVSVGSFLDDYLSLIKEEEATL